MSKAGPTLVREQLLTSGKAPSAHHAATARAAHGMRCALERSSRRRYENPRPRAPRCTIPPLHQVEGQPWVPDGSTVGPRFLGGNRGFPHKNRQPWVPATSVLFCVRWATRPNCQPLTLSHLESDGGPTASMPSAARPHCILPARNLETLTIF